MVGRTKSTGRWKLRSPRKRTTASNPNPNSNFSGDAAEQQQGAVPAIVQAPTPEENGPGGTPAPSPLGHSQSQLPPPPRGESTRPERGRPKEHHISDEFRLSDDGDEPHLPSVGRRVGGRSRSPLLGLRILAKNFSRNKGRRRDKEEAHGGEGVRPPEQAGTGSDSTKKTRLSPREEPDHPKCHPEASPCKDLTGSVVVDVQQGHPPVAAAVEEDTPATGELKHAAGMLRSDDQLVKGGKVANELSETGKRQRAQRAPPQIAFVGVFLNGIAVTLASYAPVGGADARALVKSVRHLM